MVFTIVPFLLLTLGAHSLAATAPAAFTVKTAAANSTAVSQRFARLNGKEPLNVLYIRDGKLVGDRNGELNATLAKLQPREDTAELITIGPVDINLLEVAKAGAIVATFACVWFTGCPQKVGTNIRGFL